MHNKYLGNYAIKQAEELDRIAPEQYVRQKSKSMDSQVLNIRLFYDIVRQNFYSNRNICRLNLQLQLGGAQHCFPRFVERGFPQRTNPLHVHYPPKHVTLGWEEFKRLG